jgi:hypothetical protein
MTRMFHISAGAENGIRRFDVNLETLNAVYL